MFSCFLEFSIFFSREDLFELLEVILCISFTKNGHETFFKLHFAVLGSEHFTFCVFSYFFHIFLEFSRFLSEENLFELFKLILSIKFTKI